MTSVREKVTTTVTGVELNAADKKEHDSAHDSMLAEASRNGTAGNSRVRSMVRRMLDIAAKPKAQALERMVTNLRKDQETVIFSRSMTEHRLVMEACLRSGRRPLEFTPERNEYDEWLREGGILAAASVPKDAGPDLNKARKCVYFGRPTSREGFKRVSAMVERAGRRRNLEVIHIITRNSIDAAVARSLMEQDPAAEQPAGENPAA